MSQWKQMTPEGIALTAERIRAIADRYDGMAEQLQSLEIDSFKARGMDTLSLLLEKIEANARSNEGYLEKAITDRKYAERNMPLFPGVYTTSAEQLQVAEDLADMDAAASKSDPTKQKPVKKRATKKKAAPAKRVETESETGKRKSG